MRRSEEPRANELSAALDGFHVRTNTLTGLQLDARKAAFVEQLIESERRVRYHRVVASRPIGVGRCDPQRSFFDPHAAAILHARAGRLDEACWLVFLSVHFGKHRRAQWRLTRDVYGALGADTWTWETTSENPAAFRDWLDASQHTLDRKFGNHRKYESLNARSKVGTGECVETYIAWVLDSGSHRSVLDAAEVASGGDPRRAFDHLYRSMTAVARFGRTARFDYLVLLMKLQLADIEPGSIYLTGSTGPRRGDELLLGSGCSNRYINDTLAALGADLGVGMDVLEDALCNWQKSPGRFVPFRG